MAGRGEQCWKWEHVNRTAAYPTDRGLALSFCGQAPGSLLSRDARGCSLVLMFTRAAGVPS